MPDITALSTDYLKLFLYFISSKEQFNTLF